MADWQMPPDWLAWAVAEGMVELAAHREAARFKDYWLGKPGKDGVKLDWQATWRNWVRKAIQDAKPIGRAAQPQIGDRRVNAEGQAMEYEGDNRGWVKVFQ